MRTARRFYGGLKVTPQEREALDRLYSNKHNAFTHSALCDEYLGASAMLDEVNDPPRLLPGGEVDHVECNCWCHVPRFDPNEPPEDFDTSEPPLENE